MCPSVLTEKIGTAKCTCNINQYSVMYYSHAGSSLGLGPIWVTTVCTAVSHLSMSTTDLLSLPFPLFLLHSATPFRCGWDNPSVCKERKKIHLPAKFKINHNQPFETSISNVPLRCYTHSVSNAKQLDKVTLTRTSMCVSGLFLCHFLSKSSMDCKLIYLTIPFFQELVLTLLTEKKRLAEFGMLFHGGVTSQAWNQLKIIYIQGDGGYANKQLCSHVWFARCIHVTE